jgi:hypothetical protein
LGPAKVKFPQAFLPRSGTKMPILHRKKSVIMPLPVFRELPRGRGHGKRYKAGCVMMRFSARLLAVFLSIGLAQGFASPRVSPAGSMIRVSDPSICIDGMETAPISDDQEPILAAADVGCPAPEGPISI